MEGNKYHILPVHLHLLRVKNNQFLFVFQCYTRYKGKHQIPVVFNYVKFPSDCYKNSFHRGIKTLNYLGWF